jgi:phosphopantothenoylcysteine decarboxylase
MNAVEGVQLPLQNRRIVLGVTGSIAAYKAADLTSLLVRDGAIVHVVMTEAATRLIAPITLQTLSRQPVWVDLWDENGWQPGHIQLADEADLLAVVPATANTVAAFAQGLAPNLLCNIYLATRAPVLLAPAMNGKMLEHPATQRNLAELARRGHCVLETQEGMLACGYEGLGRLAPVETIHSEIRQILARSA